MKPIIGITGRVRNGIMTTVVQYQDGEVKGYAKRVRPEPTPAPTPRLTTEDYEDVDVDDIMLFINALPRWRQRQSK